MHGRLSWRVLTYVQRRCLAFVYVCLIRDAGPDDADSDAVLMMMLRVLVLMLMLGLILDADGNSAGVGAAGDRLPGGGSQKHPPRREKAGSSKVRERSIIQLLLSLTSGCLKRQCSLNLSSRGCASARNVVL